MQTEKKTIDFVSPTSGRSTRGARFFRFIFRHSQGGIGGFFRFPQAFFFLFCRLFGISIDFLIRRVLFVIPGVAALDHFPIDIPVPIGDHTDNPTVAVAVFHGNGDRFAPDQLDQF